MLLHDPFYLIESLDDILTTLLKISLFPYVALEVSEKIEAHQSIEIYLFEFIFAFLHFLEDLLMLRELRPYLKDTILDRFLLLKLLLQLSFQDLRLCLELRRARFFLGNPRYERLDYFSVKGNNQF